MFKKLLITMSFVYDLSYLNNRPIIIIIILAIIIIIIIIIMFYRVL